MNYFAHPKVSVQCVSKIATDLRGAVVECCPKSLVTY